MQLSKRILVLLFALALATACAKSARPSGALDDATITTRVKTAFINDPLVGGLRIDVDTFKGVVTLSGRVNNEQEQQKAIDLARKIRGVVDVQSKLQIQQ